ncbi:alpha-xylosidase [Microbacterium sp.]|uniref:alpha-xylosidase n=1 Tax=Microbacterium sp. TaxID=51671 RepID=UPI0039E4188C
MKFTDGFWQLRPGVTAVYAEEAYDVWRTQNGDGDALVVTAPTAVIASRGHTLNRPVLTVTLSAPMEGVVRVRIAHHEGGSWHGGFDLPGATSGSGAADADAGTLTTGPLTARIATGAPWNLSFEVDGRRVTGSGRRSAAHLQVAGDAQVDAGVADRSEAAGERRARTFVHERLDLGVGELIYGLGERFGPLVKNGQTVETWNADGGTASEQAYKSIPFFLSNRGYGVLVNDPGHVSYEVGSEVVERVQFSVPGEVLEYFVIAGPTPKDVLARYTALTGRPPTVPAWSYGLWLSTSFTTDYDEATVTSFVDEMARRELPVSVFHFDCFWMREFNWCDFEWDPRVFPDPDGMLARLHERDLRVCVWINPYIGQRSPLFAEAADQGFLLTRPDGSVWQWDMWQAGMGLVDFTNPDAVAWFQGHLRRLVAQGVDCFKTDFGERIPVDVVYADGSDPQRLHNLYAQLYNRAVHDVLVEARGADDAVLFARSATTGGQSMPVHWGGDSSSTYASMAETLRGGLSLAFSGFAYWSHDIGGFEGTPDVGVFKRWTAFGLLGSHSRFHGSQSYRVPWAFDEEAVEVTRIFTRLKMRLMPYLYRWGSDAAASGVPLMRPLALEFPGDPAVAYLDRQYMLGPDLLVAPVFSPTGDVEFYLPDGTWTSLLTGESVEGGRWLRENHGYTSLPLYVRPGAVLPWGARDDRPDYDYLDGLALRVFPGGTGIAEVSVLCPDGRTQSFAVDRADVTG